MPIYQLGHGSNVKHTISYNQLRSAVQCLAFLFPKYKQLVFEWDKTNAKHPIHTPHKYITRHDIVTHKNGMKLLLLHVVDAFSYFLWFSWRGYNYATPCTVGIFTFFFEFRDPLRKGQRAKRVPYNKTT